MSKREFICLCLITLCGLAIFGYKIFLGRLDYVGDYQTYIATSVLFSGQPTTAIFPQRVLKPLEPALVTLLVIALPGLSFQSAFLFWVGVMYVLLVFSVWFFFKKFNLDRDPGLSPGASYLALAATAMFALSYPMLRYGLDAYTETGALAFYVLGLIGCLYFLKKPGWKILFINLAIAVFGFFWKEYSLLPLGILNIIIVFHPLLRGQKAQKLKYLVALDGLFLIPNIVWQVYVKLWLNYNYLSWYARGVASVSPGNQLFFILKSLFALLIVGWVFVPFALRSVRELEKPRKFFFWLVVVVPLVVLAWGAVSSRLFYVLMPGLCLACVWGIKRVFPSRMGQIISLALILVSGLVWFAVSTRIA